MHLTTRKLPKALLAAFLPWTHWYHPSNILVRYIDNNNSHLMHHMHQPLLPRTELSHILSIFSLGIGSKQRAWVQRLIHWYNWMWCANKHNLLQLLKVSTVLETSSQSLCTSSTNLVIAKTVCIQTEIHLITTTILWYINKYNCIALRIYEYL